jgi:hypothetical protein
MAENADFPRERATPVACRVQSSAGGECRRLLVEVKEQILEATRPMPNTSCGRAPRKLVIWQFGRSYTSLSLMSSIRLVQSGDSDTILSAYRAGG